MSNVKFKFSDFEHYSLKGLRQIRKGLRDTLADEIHKRDAIKAEILFLQKEIEKYQSEEG